MSERLRWLVGCLAAGCLLVAVGAAFGYQSVSADGLKCGTAFHESTDMGAEGIQADLTGDLGAAVRFADCQQARSNRAAPAHALVGVGVGLLVLTVPTGIWLRRRDNAEHYPGLTS